jgi:hypothetical protein
MIAQCVQMTRVVTLKTRLLGDILGREAASNIRDYRRGPSLAIKVTLNGVKTAC